MKEQLSGRELQIMKILWSSDKPLIASDIYRVNPEISINTIHQVLKTLLKKGFIEVADIVYSGTVLTRSYVSSISLANYIKDNFFAASTINAVASFIEQESNQQIINELNELLMKKREELKKH